MYCRMMMVSRRLAQAEQEGRDGEDLYWARRELYRAQCNCSYWHGAFGGIYLPHLRNAVYNHLIAADNLLDKTFAVQPPYVQIDTDDYDFDVRQEVRLANERLLALIAPAMGGILYELDVRPICHNLLATLTRRPESYHRKVVAGSGGADDDCASIHDRVVFKQDGLDRELRYDLYPRKSLVDHFYDNDVSLESIFSGEAMERGDFAGGTYEARLRRSDDRAQALLVREGNAWGIPLTISKGVKLLAGSSSLEIAYLIEGLPQDDNLHFAVEFNFAGMPAGAEDRFFVAEDGQSLGDLATKLDLQQVTELGLTDQWLGLAVRLKANRPTGIWTMPISTVSQSESGIEMVHQSVSVQPHWLVRGDQDGRWSVTIQLDVDTSLAESRNVEVERVMASGVE
jgi:alpha-amylase